MTALRPPPRIALIEQARRADAVAAARASVELEGFVLPTACAEADRRFINGELTNAEHTAEYQRIARQAD